jgi:hypothetical protein
MGRWSPEDFRAINYCLIILCDAIMVDAEDTRPVR